MRIDGPHFGMGSACETILRALPDWFGIESAIVEYVNGVQSLPTFMAIGDSGGNVGFVTIKRHFPQSAEPYVLGVLQSHHRRGVGRLLIAAIEAWARREGIRYLQVKTLAPQRQCAWYEMTRLFYEAVGFVPLEVFPTLWDPRNPCLLMVKALG